MTNGLALATDEMPLLTVQELRAAEAPRAYRPHTTTKPAPFDWDALTPTCSSCSAKSGTVNTATGLCATCERPAPRPAPRPANVTRRRASTPTKRRSGRPPRVPLDVDAVVEAYTGGQSLYDIATALGSTYKTVRQAVIDADIELRNDLSRPRRTTPCEHGNAKSTCDACRIARNETRRNGRTRGPQPRVDVDEQRVIADYLAGQTAPQIAAQWGVLPKRIRTILDRNNIERRDDRATRSGSHRKTYPAETVEQVRRLYLEERLSQPEVARRLGLTPKIVYTIMVRHDIPGRVGENGHINGNVKLKDRVDALGVPVQDIKSWALDQGLLHEIAPGLPPMRVVDAYATAHRLDGAA